MEKYKLFLERKIKSLKIIELFHYTLVSIYSN
jgi:hypothetical protein